MSANMTPARTYRIEGMSCGHCREAVIEEVSAVEGVEAVEVELETGRADVRGHFDDERIREAVEEAGYRLGEAR
jgi:copper chaperone